MMKSVNPANGTASGAARARNHHAVAGCGGYGNVVESDPPVFVIERSDAEYDHREAHRRAEVRCVAEEREVANPGPDDVRGMSAFDKSQYCSAWSKPMLRWIQLLSTASSVSTDQM
ncbi:MAG: hypothetical protein ACLR8Y_06670 [Alistipes indistinctus]